MSIVTIATGTLLLGLRWALECWSIPPRWAHPLATGITGLVLLNSPLHLYLAAEPWQTTNLPARAPARTNTDAQRRLAQDLETTDASD